jgi:glycosyltransferase involved in cell wall biosynthesis
MSGDFFWRLVLEAYVAFTLIQLVIWWVVFGKLARFSPKISVLNKVLPVRNTGSIPVSVVICARNEAVNLRRHLPGILEQQYDGDWEVVVVDDASEDETPDVLCDFQRQYPRLRVVRVGKKRHGGKKEAVEQGIEAAAFGYLLTTDADCEPASPYWISRMAATWTEKEDISIVLGYGPLRCGLEWARFEAVYTAVQYFSCALAGMPYMGVGRNLGFTKKAFGQGGGFSAHRAILSGDDDLLVNAVARTGEVGICLHPASFMRSAGKDDWKSWIRQKRRHTEAGKYYRPLHQMALAICSVSHVLHYFLFVCLLFSGFGTVHAVLWFSLRAASVWWLYRPILRLLGESALFSRIPVYDALLAVYYGALVPFFLIFRQPAQEWK